MDKQHKLTESSNEQNEYNFVSFSLTLIKNHVQFQCVIGYSAYFYPKTCFLFSVAFKRK